MRSDWAIDLVEGSFWRGSRPFKWLDAVRHKAADAAVSQTDDPERSQNPSRPIFAKIRLKWTYSKTQNWPSVQFVELS